MSGYNWNMQQHTITVMPRVWNLRGVTTYCEWCKGDADHNTEYHRERLIKGRQG